MHGKPSEPVTLAPVIELRGVAKNYYGKPALAPIDLSIARGERLGLLGHNGAGKTTLIKLICALTRPSRGAILLNGASLRATKNWRQQIGYMPEHAAFHGAMTGREVLQFYARLKQVPLSDCDRLLDEVGLATAVRQTVGSYSKGMRQRLLLAQALLGKPSLLLLDEPTSGLDPQLRRTFYQIIEARRNAGVTVLISSHAIAELETQTDRVAILRQGQLLVCATYEQLLQKAGIPVRMTVCLSPASSQRGFAVCKQAGADVQQLANGRLQVICDSTQKIPLLRELTQLGDELQDIDIRQPGLDQIYGHINASAASADAPRRPS